MIESVANAQIKQLIKLRKKPKERWKQGLFLAEGWKLAKEAVELGMAKKLYVTQIGLELWKEMVEKQKEESKKDTRLVNASLEVVSDTIFANITDMISPQGILALVKMPCYDMESIFLQEKANLLFLEEIRDPGNLGTIFRTAECAGINGIILSNGCVDIFNPKVVRATMGTILRMPFVYVQDFILAMKRAKEYKIQIFGAHLKGKQNFFLENYQGKTAFLIGNEANGMTEKASLTADVLVKIPMEGHSESLNASIAASLIMYEAYRQKLFAGKI